MKRYFYQNGKIFTTIYEGEEDTVGGNNNDTLEGGGGNDTLPTDVRVTFTKEQQELFNKQIAAERRKLQGQNEKTIKELEKLKSVQGITQKQRDDLQGRIDELQAQYLSKEELLKKEKDKLAKDHQTELQRVSGEKENWKSLYHNSTITRALLDASMRNEAYAPEQIVAILEKNTRLVEENDEEGKPNGNLIPRVKFSDQDREGKPITLDLTVEEAVKRMKELPEKYGNLFKSGVNGGLGGSGNNGNNRRPADLGKMSMAEYMEWRKKNAAKK